VGSFFQGAIRSGKTGHFRTFVEAGVLCIAFSIGAEGALSISSTALRFHRDECAARADNSYEARRERRL
jgi:hypothetical protein